MLLKLAAVALVIYLVFHFLRRPRNLRIDVRRGRATVRGPIPESRRGLIQEFIEDNLHEVPRARVDGFWDGNQLHLRFHGPLSPGEQQRIRNFLLTVL